MYLNDALYHTKNCAENDDYVCKELAEGWLMTPEQVKRAIDKWRADWPGNTIGNLKKFFIALDLISSLRVFDQGRLGCHSRASFWASAICAGVMSFATSSLSLAAR